MALILYTCSIYRLFSWPLLHTYYKIARVVELQLNMDWFLGHIGHSWPKNQSASHPSLYHHPEVSVGLPGGNILHAFKNIFLFVRTDFSHCISLKAGQHFLYNAEPLVPIYIARKIHQNY